VGDRSFPRPKVAYRGGGGIILLPAILLLHFFSHSRCKIETNEHIRALQVGDVVSEYDPSDPKRF